MLASTPRTPAVALDPLDGMRPPTERELRQLAALVHDASGIALNETKGSLVMRRLSSRVRALGLKKLGEYVTLVAADKTGDELIRLLDLLATNETHFFREPQHFEFLGAKVFPEWMRAAEAGNRPRIIRTWSAACSTGQEPYSLAMQMLTHFPQDAGWQIDILGTDMSTTALAAAKSAEWSIDYAKEIPKEHLKRFMLKGLGERAGRMRAGRELRRAVRFDRVNLNDAHYDVPGTFDLIFCRNVLIYFSPERRPLVIERLIAKLAPDGLLFVGHAESLHGHRDRLRAVRPTIYARCA